MKQSIIDFAKKYNIDSFEYDDKFSEKDNLISAVHLLFLMNRKYEYDNDDYYGIQFGPCRGILNGEQEKDIMKLDMGIMIKVDINEVIR